MPKELASLQADEQQLMFDAIPYITILIAGADGDINLKETEWGEKITKIRSYSYDDKLVPYYKRVGEQYGQRLKELLAALPNDTQAREEAVSAELAKLNGILPKLDFFYASLYYESLVSFARHVAEAAGGILGIMSISSEERRLLDLPMIEEPTE